MHSSLSQLVLATTNTGKVAEIRRLMTPLKITIKTLAHFRPIAETGLSFIENALIKARYGAEISQQPCLADDSGLMVPALNNEPGIYSARYAGKKATERDNRSKLLAALANKEAREAYFCCVIALVQDPNQADPYIATGYWHGTIATEERGDKGFGYDAIFVPTGYEQTAAELEPQQKNRISHRGQALRQVVEFIRAQGM